MQQVEGHRPPSHRNTATSGSRAALVLLCLSVLLAAGCSRDRGEDWNGEPPEQVTATAERFFADELVLRGPAARRVAGYRLTTDRVERWFVAQERLEQLAMFDPDVAHFLTADGAPSAGDANAIDRAIARIASHDGVRSTIEGAGISPNDFVLTALAMHQALMATQQNAPRALRRLASRNMRFVANNQSLIARQALQHRVDLAWLDTLPMLAYPEPYDLPYDHDAQLEVDTLAVTDTSSWALPPDPLGTDTLLSPPELPRPEVEIPPPVRVDTLRPQRTLPPVPPLPAPTPRDTSSRTPPRDTSARVPPVPPPLPVPLPRPEPVP